MEGVESDGRGARAPVLNGAEREVALGTCHLRAAEAGPAGRGRGRACGRRKGTASRGESDDPGLRGRRSSRRSGPAESPVASTHGGIPQRCGKAPISVMIWRASAAPTTFRKA